MSKKKIITESENHLSGLLGQGSSFEGEIFFHGIFRVDGHISGRIFADNQKSGSTVIIGPNSIVEADIIADNILVSGRVLGNLMAMNKIEVFSGGKLEGLVFTNDLVMKPGALFHGQCVMLKEYSKEEKIEIREDLLQSKAPRVLSTPKESDSKIYQLEQNPKFISP